MVERRGIDVDAAGSLPNSGAKQGVASKDVDSQILTRLFQYVVEAKVRCMVRFKLLAEKGRINA